MRDVLLENIDKIAAAVASKLKTKLKDRTTFVRNEQRLMFVKKYDTLCAMAYKDSNISCRDSKKPVGKSIVELARQELNYKKTTYSGDIYRLIGITYLKSIGKWKY
jgi:translation initiation factor 2 alpha subunit (eIF-2alpha)